MRNLESAALIDAISQLSRLSQLIVVTGQHNLVHEAEYFNHRILAGAEAIHSQCQIHALAASTISAERLIERLRIVAGTISADGDVRIDCGEAARIKNYANELTDRIRDELGSRQALVLKAEDGELFVQIAPVFGDDVAGKLPDAAGDISEAAKCLALANNTACVFHLMRAMEWGVRAMSKHLGVSDIERVWGNLLRDTKQRAEVLPQSSSEEKKLRRRWLEIHALLYAVKGSMRNDVMHPSENVYSEIRAREVFVACRGFMRALAELLPAVPASKTPAD